jgi:hypothetical protein
LKVWIFPITITITITTTKSKQTNMVLEPYVTKERLEE